MLKCIKFGGSSLATADLFLKAKSVISSDSKICAVVVSAIGKRFEDDMKITDLLYALSDLIESGREYINAWSEIKARFKAINEGLKIGIDLEREFQIIEKAFTAEELDLDYIASRGEYLTAKMMAAFLNFEFVDSAEVIRFKDCVFDQKSTYKSIKSKILNKKVVIPGFYGADEKGRIRLFSRDGSDFSGALIARGVGAKVYQIVTDVKGFLTADPKIVKKPKSVPYLSYADVDGLTSFSAKVIKREALFPLVKKDIPLLLTDVDGEGTFICGDIRKCAYVCMAGCDNLLLFKAEFLPKSEGRIVKLTKTVKKRALLFVERSSSLIAVIKCEDYKFCSKFSLSGVDVSAEKIGAVTMRGNARLIKKAVSALLRSKEDLYFLEYDGEGCCTLGVKNGKHGEAIKFLHGVIYGE